MKDGGVESAKVDAIQCKHFLKSPGAEGVKKWLNSLGVNSEQENWSQPKEMLLTRTEAW